MANVDYKAEALRMLSAIGGGALAGALDIELASTMPLGLPVGAWAGFGLTLAGLAGQSSPSFRGAASHIGEVGIGMLSAEAGFATASRLVKMKQAAAQAAPAQAAGLPRARPQTVSAQSLRQQFATMGAR